MRRPTLVLLLAGCTPELPLVDDPCATWEQPGLYALPVGDFDRRPFIYVPASEGPRGGLVVLHGVGGSGGAMLQDVTSFVDRADREGFVAVFPNGTGVPGSYAWNAGSCCGTASLTGIDDVAFLDEVSRVIRDRVCVDAVVAAGHSNGAMMAQRWACQGEQLDGAYSSAGQRMVKNCEGDPIPLITAHGTADRVVPQDGGTNADDVSFPSEEESREPFLARNGCSAEGVSETTDGIATCRVWDCADAPVEACTLDDWKHRWPGGPKVQPEGYRAEDVVVDLLARVRPDESAVE